MDEQRQQRCDDGPAEHQQRGRADQVRHAVPERAFVDHPIVVRTPDTLGLAESEAAEAAELERADRRQHVRDDQRRDRNRQEREPADGAGRVAARLHLRRREPGRGRGGQGPARLEALDREGGVVWGRCPRPGRKDHVGSCKE
nr:hypothetical protein GCM10025732_51080 [Glycomyces mayteni]